MSNVLVLSLLAALPVPKSIAEVEAQLAQKDAAALVEAVGNVGKACRGSLRLVLRDHAGVLGKLGGIASGGNAETKKAVLASSRCFRPAAFAPTYAKLIEDADPEVVAYALEIVSNTQDAALAPLVLEHEEKVASACVKAQPAGPALEACVWAAYAPSTLIGSAPRDVRERAAKAAEVMMAAEPAKIREVAVESMAATKLKAGAAVVAELIAKEKEKKFAAANDAALLKRFADRQKALEKGE